MIRRLAASTPRQQAVGLLLLRLWFGLVLALGHGLPKLGRLEGFVEGVAKMGLPAPALMAYAAVGAELVGGLMLALGLLTRLSAVPVAITMLVAAFLRHASDPWMKKEFALAYAAAALVLFVTGGGRFSLDALLFGKAPPLGKEGD